MLLSHKSGCLLILYIFCIPLSTCYKIAHFQNHSLSASLRSTLKSSPLARMRRSSMYFERASASSWERTTGGSENVSSSSVSSSSSSSSVSGAASAEVFSCLLNFLDLLMGNLRLFRDYFLLLFGEPASPPRWLSKSTYLRILSPAPHRG